MVGDILKNIDTVVKDIKTIKDALHIAITIEKQGMQFYIKKTGSASAAARDLFKYLATEEEKHITYLEDFRKKKEVAVIIGDDTPDFSSSFSSEFSENKPGEMDVLLGALRFEQKNEKFYRQLAGWAEDPGQKEFFDMMAKFEHGHWELIDGFVELATQFRMQT